jgi:hypothetical protein
LKKCISVAVQCFIVSATPFNTCDNITWGVHTKGGTGGPL